MGKTVYHPKVLGGCGIFGMMQHNGDRVRSTDVIKGICSVQKDRGSPYGAGFGYAHPDGPKTLQGRPLVKIFVREEGHEATKEKIRGIFSMFKDRGIEKENELVSKPESGYEPWRVILTCNDPIALSDMVIQINNEMQVDGITLARVFSAGKYTVIYKGVSWADELARRCDLYNPNLTAIGAVAHTRQATNSDADPSGGHPHGAGTEKEIMIVHNGEINSIGVSRRFVEDVLGIRTFAGPDSELIAILMRYLIVVEGLSVLEAALLLMKPYEKDIIGGRYGDLSPAVIDLSKRFKAATLDGPFAVAMIYTDGNDTYLIGIADRGKLRPLIIGKGGGYFFVASEEGQIRNICPKAAVWSVEPGRLFLASHNEGIIEKGQIERKPFFFKGMPSPNLEGVEIIDATSLSSTELYMELAFRHDEKVAVIGLNRHRYVASAAKDVKNIVLKGAVGNLFGEFNRSDIDVFGNVADVGLSKQNAGDVYIFGQVGDVFRYAADGGRAFVRNSVGNRANVLAREDVESDKKPVLVVGTTAGAFFGEYMVGGLAIVLNAGDSVHPVAHCAATGMVGGKMYIRGKVESENIGLPPSMDDVRNCLDVLEIEGQIDKRTYDHIINKKIITLAILEGLVATGKISQEGFKIISKLFKDRLTVEYRKLKDSEMEEIGVHLRDFASKFDLQNDVQTWLDSRFTIIEPTPEEVQEKAKNEFDILIGRLELELQQMG